MIVGGKLGNETKEKVPPKNRCDICGRPSKKLCNIKEPYQPMQICEWCRESYCENDKVTTESNISRYLSKPKRAVYSLYQQRKIKRRVHVWDDGKIHIYYRGRDLTFEKESYIYELYEQFIEGQYGNLDIKGRTVIDLGGSIADTAIYFMMNDAKRVVAFEPDGDRFRIAIPNLKQNNIKNVKMINKAMWSLDEIDKYCRTNDRVLKCDVDGGEHRIFSNSSRRSIRSFKEIILEFHDGAFDIIKILERSGFRIIRYEFSKYYSADFNGLIYARRIG